MFCREPRASTTHLCQCLCHQNLAVPFTSGTVALETRACSLGPWEYTGNSPTGKELQRKNKPDEAQPWS